MENIIVNVSDLVGACNGARRATEADYEYESFIAAIEYVLNLGGYKLNFEEDRALYYVTKC